MNDFDIHYLYAIKPLNLEETGNVLSVLSAEDDYNRYVDTEGNLYLGWVSEDEYDAETVLELFRIMEQDEIVFCVEKTGWSTDYTGALPLRLDGEAYAILCVDVDITELSTQLWSQALENTGVILLLGIAYMALFLLWTEKNVTLPVRLLEQGVVDYADRSQGQHDVEALKFDAPVIHTDNEVESLSRAITQMTENMQDYVSEILSAEEKTRKMKRLADTMSELATVDSMTGALNKTAFSRDVEKLDRELAQGKDAAFAVAMIDLNFLKVINDTYGHEKGDEAIKKIAQIASEVFARSPVYRVGGDEFVVLLRGDDYRDAKPLMERLLAEASGDPKKEPWRLVSAAAGLAYYEPERDRSVEDVLKRADQAMYAMKKEMNALR